MALRHRDPETRRLAADTLGRGRARKATGALLRALADDDRRVRISAINALGTIGGDDAREALLKLVQDEDKWIRRSAISVLTGVDGDRAIELLATMAEHSDPERRQEAARQLGDCAGKTPLRLLLSALGDADDGVRRAATLSLQRCVYRQEHVKGMWLYKADRHLGAPPYAIEAILRRLARDDDPAVRETASRTASQRGGAFDFPREGHTATSSGEMCGSVDGIDDTELTRAYLQTSFFVNTSRGRLRLRIGEVNPDLDALLKAEGVWSWAYVTACNPGSTTLHDDDNGRRQAALEEEVWGARFGFFRGEGVGDDGQWPAEPSLLVLGIEREAALDLGRRHGQWAIVYGTIGRSPALLFCS